MVPLLLHLEGLTRADIAQAEVADYAWENYQFQGWEHFKSVMPSPMNPIEFVNRYGQIRPAVVGFSQSSNDRGTQVEIRKSE